ncbi:MAG: hypothetical protein ACREFF_01340 [Candidatus Udaeobacter sp.]
MLDKRSVSHSGAGVARRAGRKCEQIREPRLVGIAHWGFAVWQNPLGMLYPQVIMNQLAEVPD